MGCTFVGNSAPEGSNIIAYHSSLPAITHSIIVFGSGGAGFDLVGPAEPILTCCDMYGNEGGDWRWPLINQLEVDGNICLDPCYCDPGLDDWQLWNYSPCNQEGCGLIGAWPVGCWDPQGAEEEGGGVGLPAGLGRLALAQVTPNPSAGAVRIGAGGCASHAPGHSIVFASHCFRTMDSVARPANSGPQSVSASWANRGSMGTGDTDRSTSGSVPANTRAM
jgi:hypothetical protein